MTTEQFEQHVTQLQVSSKQLREKKRKDYDSANDPFSTFKQTSAILQSTPQRECLSMIAVKVSRINNLIAQGSKPTNESLEDSVKDLFNYTLMLSGMLQDTKTQSLKSVNNVQS